MGEQDGSFVSVDPQRARLDRERVIESMFIGWFRRAAGILWR